MFRDALKTMLSGCVKNLKRGRYRFFVVYWNQEPLTLKIDPDGRHTMMCELAKTELRQDIALPYAAFPKYHNFV